MSCCRKLRFFIAFLCAFCMLSASAQERGVDNHFYVFVKENDGTRMDLPVNEHVESKITGVLRRFSSAKTTPKIAIVQAKNIFFTFIFYSKKNYNYVMIINRFLIF